MPGDNTNSTERQDTTVNHTPRPEGAARSRNKGLSDVCKYTLYLGQWYAAHVGRGKWQEARIAEHKEMLKVEKNRGKVATFTTDMKSKTVSDKHKCEQGYRMGLKGMSLQGGMLNFCNKDTKCCICTIFKPKPGRGHVRHRSSARFYSSAQPRH
jgi:hypothetical protein